LCNVTVKNPRSSVLCCIKHLYTHTVKFIVKI